MGFLTMSTGTSQANLPEFSPWRARLWPIYNHEIKKFLPLAMIMFFLLFNYTILRDTKDTLVVNAAGAGAITFLKSYCVTPAAIVFVIMYAKMLNALGSEKTFYAMVAGFLVFFGLFGFVFYPNLASLHPGADTISALHTEYPRLSGFIDIYAYWTYSAFYVMSEIWGSAMIALLFWQFANQITRMSESKRFYGLFVVVGNAALLLSGPVVHFCSEGIKVFFPDHPDIWQVSLYLLMGSVVAAGVAAMWLFRWMHTDVLTDKLYYDPEEQSGPKKKKDKPGLIESAKIVFTSPELGLIAALIMAYGVTINLVEVQWKQQLKEYFGGDKGGYNGFMGLYSFWTGFATIIFSLFIGSNVLRKVSWFSAAVITPLVIIAGGAAFFIFIVFENASVDLLKALATNPVTAATFMGAFVVIMSKAIKYSLFDPTKEMAYIPLDDELKSKGKAAVDVIGGRAGKAGGAMVQSWLLIAFATKDVVAIAPVTLGVFALVGLLWLIAVKGLSKKVAEAIVRKESQKAA